MTGEGLGAGYNINVPWENGLCGDADYFAVWDHLLIPVVKEFNPDIIIIPAGFDAATGDPIGGCRLSPYGYSIMLDKLMNFARGKIVMALEGGYNPESLANSSQACIEVLLQDKPSVRSLENLPLESTWLVIKAVRQALCKYWPVLAAKLPDKLTNNTSSQMEVDTRAGHSIQDEVNAQTTSLQMNSKVERVHTACSELRLDGNTGKKVDLESGRAYKNALREQAGAGLTQPPTITETDGIKLDLESVRAYKNALREHAGARLTQPPTTTKTDGECSGSLPHPSMEPRLSDPPNSKIRSHAEASPHILLPRKRVRDGTNDTSPFHGDCDGVKRFEEFESFLETTEAYSRFSKMMSMMMEDYDPERYSHLSCEQLSEGVTRSITVVGTISTMLREEAVQRKSYIARLEAAEKKSNEEISRLKAKIDKATTERDSWKDRFDREVLTGKKFLESKTGKAYLATVKEDAVSEFKASSSFHDVVLDRASIVYEQTIRECRRALRESGRFPNEDFMLLDPTVPELVDENAKMKEPY